MVSVRFAEVDRLVGVLDDDAGRLDLLDDRSPAADADLVVVVLDIEARLASDQRGRITCVRREFSGMVRSSTVFSRWDVAISRACGGGT